MRSYPLIAIADRALVSCHIHITGRKQLVGVLFARISSCDDFGEPSLKHFAAYGHSVDMDRPVSFKDHNFCPAGKIKIAKNGEQQQENANTCTRFHTVIDTKLRSMACELLRRARPRRL